jgi:DNA-binding NarL/FixJ family response regulator
MTLNDSSEVRVLVVDDNLQWRTVLAAYLRVCSVAVVGVAENGADALEQAGVLQPDVVIMDLWMPVLNGVDATRELATVAPAARVLIVSTECDIAIVEAAFAAGARGYLQKAFALTELVPAIAALIGGGEFVGRGLARGDD